MNRTKLFSTLAAGTLVALGASLLPGTVLASEAPAMNWAGIPNNTDDVRAAFSAYLAAEQASRDPAAIATGVVQPTGALFGTDAYRASFSASLAAAQAGRDTASIATGAMQPVGAVFGTDEIRAAFSTSLAASQAESVHAASMAAHSPDAPMEPMHARFGTDDRAN